MTKTAKLLTAACLLAVSISAKAEPTLYPKDINILKSVKNLIDSNILADEQDPSTIWVLPPNTAQATVSGLHTKTANMGFCSEMRDLQSSSRQLVADINAIQKKRTAKLDEMVKIQEKASALSQEADKFAVDKNLLALSEADTRITEFESRLTDLYRAAETCKTACDEINAEIVSVINSKKTLMKDRNDLARLNTAEIREYTKKRKAADAALKVSSDVAAVYSNMTAEIRNLRTQIHMQYQGLAQMGGARANILYKSHWDENISKLRADNGQLNFAKVATKNAKLMTELAGVDGVDPSGAIMAITAAGQLEKGVANYSAYPESLSSNVVLSLLGACPMEHPEYFDLKENDVKQMKYGVVITYEYDSVYTMKAKAVYNMYKMYQKIVRSGSKGGLFRSKSWSTVEEKNFFRDSFTVHWSDKENTLTNEQKDEREAEMRQNVMQRLATLALPAVANRAEVLAAAQPPTRGAIVASDELVKNSGGNPYVLAGAAVLRVLDAVFGSSTSEASYTQITDTEITDNYERDGKITKSWITTYL